MTLSDRAFSSQIGSGSERGLPDLGSNLAIIPPIRRRWGCGAIPAPATVLSDKQDITFARTTFSGSAGLAGPVRDLLRYGGVAAVLLGLALALGAVGRLRR